MKNFSIEISMHFDDRQNQMVKPELCQQQEKAIPMKIRTVLPCRSPIVGRFVRITKIRTAPSRLSMCQVEVYGTTTGKPCSELVYYLRRER